MLTHGPASQPATTRPVRRRPRRRVAALAVAALALGAGAGSTSTASAATNPGPSYVKSWLALRTTVTGGSVNLVNADKTLARSQVLGTGKACALTQGDGSLAVLTSSPSAPGVGFSTGSIGVREKTTSSGTSCSAVDASKAESLTLKLGTGVNGLVAMSASLDIDLKQDARVLATASLSTAPGATPTYYELQSGSNIGQPALVPGATVFTCNNPADSGPDSGVNNNCRWEISAPSWTRTKADGSPGLAEDSAVFDTLVLEARAGSFSVMGGADGPVVDPDYPLPGYLGADSDPATNDVSITSASIFELVDGAVSCGETVKLVGSIASSWKRLDNFGSTPQDPCKAFPYSTRTGTDSVGAFAEFTKPLDFQTRAQALWTTTFVVGGGAGTPPPPIRVYLDVFGSTTQLAFDPLPSCDPSYYDVNGVFQAPTSEPNGPTACLVSAVRGSGKLSKSVTYTAYVYGDAGMRY